MNKAKQLQGHIQSALARGMKHHVIEKALAAGGLTMASVSAFAVAPDFTSLTASIDFSTAISAILLVMAALAGVYIIMKGGDLILSKLRGR